MDINRTNPICASQRRSGVYVRRRRTYVTRMNELHVHYRESPSYHPYAMRTPVRVERRSTVVTTTIEEDFFVPCQSGPAKLKSNENIHRPRFDSGLPYPDEIKLDGLFAHPEVPSGSNLGIMSEEENAIVPNIKSEHSEPSASYEYRLRPVEWSPQEPQWSSSPGSGAASYVGDMESGIRGEREHAEWSPESLAVKAAPEQRHTQLYQPDGKVARVKPEPVD